MFWLASLGGFKRVSAAGFCQVDRACIGGGIWDGIGVRSVKYRDRRGVESPVSKSMRARYREEPHCPVDECYRDLSTTDFQGVLQVLFAD